MPYDCIGMRTGMSLNSRVIHRNTTFLMRVEPILLTWGSWSPENKPDRSGYLLLGPDQARTPWRPNQDEQPTHRDETEQHLLKSRFVRFGSGFSGNLGV